MLTPYDASRRKDNQFESKPAESKGESPLGSTKLVVPGISGFAQATKIRLHIMATRGSNTEGLKTAERRREVLMLRESGATYQAIAETLLRRHGAGALPKGWNDAYAAKDVSRELAKLRSANEETAESIREVELLRLDRMLRGLWSKAAAGDTKAVGAALRIMKRRAKLLGIDAPDQIEQAVSVLESEDYRTFRGQILRALEDFPEARAALAETLSSHAKKSTYAEKPRAEDHE